MHLSSARLPLASVLVNRAVGNCLTAYRAYSAHASAVEMFAHLIVASLLVSLSTASSLLSTDLYEANLRHHRTRAPLKRAYRPARLARRAEPSSTVRPQSDVVTSSSGLNICPKVTNGWALAYAYIGSGEAAGRSAISGTSDQENIATDPCRQPVSLCVYWASRHDF